MQSFIHSLTHSPTVHSHYMQLYRSFYLHFITRIDRPLMSVRPVPRHHCPGAHTLHSQHTTLVRCVQQTLTGGNSNPSIHHSTRSETHEFSSCVRSVAYHTSSERVVDQRRCSHMSYVIHYTERCTESSRKQSCKLQ